MRRVLVILSCFIYIFLLCSCSQGKMFVAKENNEGITKANQQPSKSVKDDTSRMYIIYQPTEINFEDISLEKLEYSSKIIKKRLENLGYFESEVAIDKKRKQIIVTVLGSTNIKGQMQNLGKVAKIEFRDSDEKVIITGDDIIDSNEYYINSEWLVNIKFSEGVSKQLAKETGRISSLEEDKKYIGIWLDGQLISKPKILEKIDADNVMIQSSYFNSDSARELASLISSGTLPFSLRVISIEEK